MRPRIPNLPITAARLAGAVLFAFLPRAHAAGSAPAGSAPVVAVAAVIRADLARELAVQAEFKPYNEIDLHAKVSGYLQQLKADLGDTVKSGDVIATLEVPELRQDLAKGDAAMARAEASHKEAHQQFTRLANARRAQPDLIAQQDLDLAEAKAATAAAALAEARADREKVRAMEAYTRIVAPFDGVVTKRYADPGALIQAGTSSHSQALPIVRLSQNTRLRLSFPLSVSYLDAIRIGETFQVDLGGNLGRRTLTLARFSRRISADTRTMIGEADVANPDLALIPGMYATVLLQVDRRPKALSVPVEAVAGSKQTTAFVVNAKGTIEERVLKLGIETPTRYEVLAGLSEGELVMVGSRSQVRVGQQVSPKLIPSDPAP